MRPHAETIDDVELGRAQGSEPSAIESLVVKIPVFNELANGSFVGGRSLGEGGEGESEKQHNCERDLSDSDHGERGMLRAELSAVKSAARGSGDASFAERGWETSNVGSGGIRPFPTEGKDRVPDQAPCNDTGLKTLA